MLNCILTTSNKLEKLSYFFSAFIV
jgi:hypothetical protein